MLRHESSERAADGHGRADVQVMPFVIRDGCRRRARVRMMTRDGRALIDGGGGAAFAPGTGYDGGCGQGVFSVGLQGVGEEDVAAGLEKIDRVGHARVGDDGVCG